MEGRRNPVIAAEGAPFLVVALAAFVLTLHYQRYLLAAIAGLLLVILFLIFRDPRRNFPTSPLGIVSPVDGRVLSVDHMDKDVLQGEAQRVQIRINSFGTYTARAPVEGQLKDLAGVDDIRAAGYPTHAMWLHTDEGDDVVLQFFGYRFGLAPRSFVGIGERVGQGQRCAYLRLTRVAELHLPTNTKIIVEPGQVLVAGKSLIGKLIHN